MRIGVIALWLLLVGTGTLRGQAWIQKVGGPGLGNPLTVNPLNSDILYGAAGSNRMYVSRDRGYTWANFGGLITGGGIIKSLSINPLDTTHILAGMESSVGSPDRIMKSTDGGLTWTETWSGTFSYFGQPVEFSPVHPDTVYTMGLDTLYRSIDFGSTWDTVASARGFNAWCDGALRPDSAAVMYIGDNLSGIWKTADHGDSWRKVYSTLGEIPSIAIDPFDPRVAYAGKFGGGGGLVKTTDWGETWHNVIVPSGNRDAWWVVCSPQHEGYVYYGTYTGDTARLGIYMSGDSGDTWTRLIDGLPQNAIFNYGLLTLDSLTLIALQGSGIFKYQYPTTIDILTPGGGEYWLSDSLYTITWAASGLYLVKIEYSTDFGDSWTEIADSVDAGLGSFPWTTPAILSDSCLIRISDVLFTSTQGVSDSGFTITNAYLTIDVPNGGEIWDAGSLHTIGWSSVSLDSLRIEYSADSGASWNLITNVPATAGSFGWSIPNHPSELALIRIHGVEDTNIVDISDDVFTLRYINSFDATIFVTDAGAGADTLRFGLIADATDGVDTALGEAELPPAPGAGIFDARWTPDGLDGLSTDYRDTLSGPGDAHYFRLAVQPGGGGHPMTLSWHPESLQAGAFIMRDLSGPAARYNLNMRRDSILVVEDTSVGSMEIIVCAAAEVTISGDGGWTLVSLPLETGDDRVSTNFPFSGGGAFEYRGGYVKRDTLIAGSGYWIKTYQVNLQGCPILSETVAVRPGWNIIGPPTNSLDVSEAVTQPESLISSPFYGYGPGGYNIADSLHAGNGYWVKCRDSGVIILEAPFPAAKTSPSLNQVDRRILSGYSGFTKLNQLTIATGKTTFSPDSGASAGYGARLYFGPGSEPGWLESPPDPPGRPLMATFRNGKIGVLHEYDPTYPIEYEIALNTPENEIFISWSVEIDDKFGYIIVEHDGSQEVSATPLVGSGSAEFERAKGSKFFLRVSPLNDGIVEVPTEYSMGRVYPNPFNPTTRVRFLLPIESIVSFNVYNLLGEIVVSSVDHYLPAGEHSITLDGRGNDGNMLGSGVYFLNFTARASATGSGSTTGLFRALRKLLLLR